jgi:kynurenine 3-monooxygenase
MRDAVLDARFVRRKQLAMGLERRFPERFIPRYSMVMFHPQISYAEAFRRGTVQSQLLEELERAGADAGGAHAAALVTERLAPLP